MSLGKNLKCSGCQRLWKKLIRGDNVIGHMFVLKVFFPKTALVWVIQAGLFMWRVSMIILTLQCSISRSAQFRAIIMNCGVSYPCIPLPFISFGFGRGFRYEKRSTYKRMCACRVPRFVLAFWNFHKKYQIATFSTEANALHRRGWVKAGPGCRRGGEGEG